MPHSEAQGGRVRNRPPIYETVQFGSHQLSGQGEGLAGPIIYTPLIIQAQPKAGSGATLNFILGTLLGSLISASGLIVAYFQLGLENRGLELQEAEFFAELERDIWELRTAPAAEALPTLQLMQRPFTSQYRDEVLALLSESVEDARDEVERRANADEDEIRELDIAEQQRIEAERIRQEEEREQREAARSVEGEFGPRLICYGPFRASECVPGDAR